ncbi:MAG: DUF3857 domain-containing protein [Planctomycetota bacterium]
MSARFYIIIIVVWLGLPATLRAAERIDDFFVETRVNPTAQLPESRTPSAAMAPLIKALNESRSAEANADALFAFGDYKNARAAYIRWMRQDLSAAERFAGNNAAGIKRAGIASSLLLVHADAALVLSCRACRYDASGDEDAIESLRAALPSAARFPLFADRINLLISRLAARSGQTVAIQKSVSSSTTAVSLPSGSHQDADYLKRFLTVTSDTVPSLTDDGAMFLKTELGALTGPTEEARLFYHTGLISNDDRSPDMTLETRRLARSLFLIAESIEPSYASAGFACATIDCPLPSGVAQHPLSVRRTVSRFAEKNPNHIPALYYLAWDALENRRNLSDAETLIDRMTAINPDFAPAVVLAANVCIRRGDLSGARALLATAGDSLDALAVRANLPGETLNARAAALRALDKDRANPVAYLTAAQREKETSAFSGASETRRLLNAALERFANEPRLTDALERLNRQLGTGEQLTGDALAGGETREPLDAILQDSAKTLSMTPTSDWTYLLKRDRLVFDGSGGTEIQSRRVVRINTEYGATSRRREVIAFNPASESVRIRQAVARRSSGNCREARYVVPPDTTADDGARQRAIIVFDALSSGDVLDIEWTIIRRRLDLPTDYSDALVFFDDDAPVVRSEIIAMFPPTMTLSATAVSPDGRLAIQRASVSGRLIYRAVDVPSIPSESVDRSASPADAIRPRVEISTHPAWPALSQMYYDVVRDAMVCEPETLAALNIRPIQPSEKESELHRLMQFVALSVRYQARLLGESAYRPQDADAVYALRFGDCKDKTVLTVVLLNAAGIKAHPLLVRFVPGDSERGDEDLRLARITHFNHVIVYVPKQAGLPGDRFIDPTANQYRAGALPLGNAGAMGCVVSETDGRLVRVPKVRSQNGDKSVLKNTGSGILSPVGK